MEIKCENCAYRQKAGKTPKASKLDCGDGTPKYARDGKLIKKSWPKNSPGQSIEDPLERPEAI